MVPTIVSALLYSVKSKYVQVLLLICRVTAFSHSYWVETRRSVSVGELPVQLQGCLVEVSVLIIISRPCYSYSLLMCSALCVYVFGFA